MQLAYLFHRVQFSLNFIGPESMANREKELPLPERTPLNPFGAVIEDRISNAMKISTFVEYYHNIHKTGYFYPYDPYFDCFVVFHPGFGNPAEAVEGLSHVFARRRLQRAPFPGLEESRHRFPAVLDIVADVAGECLEIRQLRAIRADAGVHRRGA